DAPDHGRRAGDLAVRPEPPADVAGRRIEGVEPAAVRAGEHEPVPHRRRRIDIAAGAIGPAQLPRGRAVGVHLAVGRADVDAPVGDGGRRVEAGTAVEAALRLRLPHETALLRAETV